MKPLLFLLCLAFFPVAYGDEDRRDVFAKTITPFLGVLAKDRKGENRAFSMKVRIEQGTDIPQALRNTPAEILLQAPDKLRLHGPLKNETFTLVRDDDRIWISPGAVARALLDAAVEGKSLPPPEKKFQLGEFKLPFPEKQMILLTTLFSVKDQGYQEVNGTECRVVDVTLMREVAESVDGGSDWVTRWWIRPDYKPARITIAKKGWNMVLGVDELNFSKELPKSTWKPADDQTDVLELKPAEYSRFLRAIGGVKGKKKKDKE